ncbi:MmcQ/YjbR family DNA-binding protein [Fulvivirga sediminis]|uniref:MmcQ/YjbR family DNA-binding protein n=1 Tax=Fulvivirga sediminis TaxID=2803949 RepID=A0A937JY84_9BACT|nr:MmcQ/YjbR family DNA-binding protein [Fulvivirga sediminis]MBL3655419.1 MmcQ/YjbR family DNA-binding protein [Fulvivirga sediminis]
MNIEWFRDYCLSMKGVTEEFPFGEQTLVFKVMGKVFALTDVDLFAGINLKCDPERAVLLREEYDAIKSGYHMSKKHWNTLEMDGTLSDNLVKQLIDHSYDLVVKGLSKKAKEDLNKIA